MTLLHKFEFDQHERQRCGAHEIILEMTALIAQQPIYFTIDDFFVINKSFLASVTTGIITYVVILSQL